MCLIYQTGIKDHLTGEYIIHLPTWSKAIYYKGTRIEYKHDQNEFDDSIVLDGPTKVPLRVVVRIYFEKTKIQ